MIPGYFQRLSLRAKLCLNLGVLWAVLGAVSLLANLALSTAAGQSDETLRTSVRQSELASQVAENTLQCRRYEKDVFLNMHDPDMDANYASKWREAYDGLTAALAEFREAASGAEDRETAEGWADDAAQYRRAMEGVFRGLSDKTIQSPERANAALTPFKDPIRKLTESSLAASQLKMSQARQAQTALTDATGFLKEVILVVTVAAVVGSLVWSYFLAADLLRPIRALGAAAVRFGEGDYYARVDLRRDDELGKLADCFNQMTAKIRERTEGKDS